LKVCAGGILVKDTKILLCKRSASLTFYPDVWDIIGGHSEEGETLEKTLSRELREELGVTPTRFVRIAVLQDPDPGIDYEYHVYLVTDWVGSPRNLVPHEHAEVRGVDLDEAVLLNLAHPEYPQLFRNVKEKRTEKRR
jgi:8-oxo-dGTP diphosphatase